MDALQGVINPVGPAFRRLAGRARPSYKKNFNASEAERDGKVLDVSNPDECWPSTRTIIGTWAKQKRVQAGGLTPREAAGFLSLYGHGALVYGPSQKALSKATKADIDGLEEAINSQITMPFFHPDRYLAGFEELNEVVKEDPHAPVFPIEAYAKLNDEKKLGDGSYFTRRAMERARAQPSSSANCSNELIKSNEQEQFPYKCKIYEACILMAGGSLKDNFWIGDDGYPDFDRSGIPMAGMLLWRIRDKLFFDDNNYRIIFEDEVFNNPGNLTDAEGAEFSVKAFQHWFSADIHNSMGLPWPKWFDAAKTPGELEPDLEPLNVDLIDLDVSAAEWVSLIELAAQGVFAGPTYEADPKDVQPEKPQKTAALDVEAIELAPGVSVACLRKLLDPKHPRYRAELAAAVSVWSSFEQEKVPSDVTPKKECGARLSDWEDEHESLGTTGRDRVLKVVNWEKFPTKGEKKN